MWLSRSNITPVVHYFRLPIFSALSNDFYFFYRVKDRYVYRLRPPTTSTVLWPTSWSHLIHGCSGESPAPGWWQPYSWNACMSVRRVSATWRRGKSQGALRWTTPPHPELHKQSIWKGKNYVFDGGKPQVISTISHYPLPGGPSWGPSKDNRTCEYSQHTYREYCHPPFDRGPILQGHPSPLGPPFICLSFFIWCPPPLISLRQGLMYLRGVTSMYKGVVTHMQSCEGLNSQDRNPITYIIILNFLR